MVNSFGFNISSFWSRIPYTKYASPSSLGDSFNTYHGRARLRFWPVYRVNQRRLHGKASRRKERGWKVGSEAGFRHVHTDTREQPCDARSDLNSWMKRSGACKKNLMSKTCQKQMFRPFIKVERTCLCAVNGLSERERKRREKKN